MLDFDGGHKELAGGFLQEEYGPVICSMCVHRSLVCTYWLPST